LSFDGILRVTTKENQMNTAIKTSWGMIYNSIRIGGSVKRGGFFVKLDTDTAFSNTYRFTTLRAAKAFVDENWNEAWVELNTK